MAGEADFIMGTRLKGDIKKGAMPWLHQYIGNPLPDRNARISCSKLKFRTHIVECGLLQKEALEKMNLKTHGMELASEMVIEAAKCGLRIKEVPMTISPRRAPSKLRSFQDGWRHIRFMMLYRPLPFLFLPGAVAFYLGALITGSLLLSGDAAESRLHSFILGSMLLMLGGQSLSTGGYMKTYGVVSGSIRLKNKTNALQNG